MRYSPCKECVPPKRCPGCHEVCKAYISWKEEWDALQCKIHMQKQIDAWARPAKPKRKR